MGRFLLGSVLTLIGSAFVGSIIVFLLLRLLSGDIATIILGKGATIEALNSLRESLGLNRSWPEQYLDWLGGLLRGDLGKSYAARYDIFQEIWSRVGLTFSLAVGTLLISSVVALWAGTYSAIHADDWRGNLVDVVAQVGLAVPTFWAALMLIGMVSVNLGWLPASGYVEWSVSPLGAIRSLVLPIAALSIPMISVLARYVRSSMLEQLKEDYVRTAMAKGYTRTEAVIKHGTRNASIQLLTVGALQFGTLIAGTVIIENVFALPGLGRMLADAVGNREAVVVQSLVFVIMMMILLLNFIMDVSYGFLDPRIRHAEARSANG
jgi:peptide/nickel transport system permease protein